MMQLASVRAETVLKCNKCDEIIDTCSICGEDMTEGQVMYCHGLKHECALCIGDVP